MEIRASIVQPDYVSAFKHAHRDSLSAISDHNTWHTDQLGRHPICLSISFTLKQLIPMTIINNAAIAITIDPVSMSTAGEGKANSVPSFVFARSKVVAYRALMGFGISTDPVYIVVAVVSCYLCCPYTGISADE